jgi:hypothetical protein
MKFEILICLILVLNPIDYIQSIDVTVDCDLFLYEVLKEKDMLNYFVNQFGLQAAYMDRNQNTAMCYRFLYELLTSLEKKKAENNDSFYENY